MARCERNTKNRGFVVYKRHKFKDGVCIFCGKKQLQHVKEQ